MLQAVPIEAMHSSVLWHSFFHAAGSGRTNILHPGNSGSGALFLAPQLASTSVFDNIKGDGAAWRALCCVLKCAVLLDAAKQLHLVLHDGASSVATVVPWKWCAAATWVLCRRRNVLPQRVVLTASGAQHSMMSTFCTVEQGAPPAPGLRCSGCLLPAAPAGSAGVEDVPDPRLQLSQQLIFSRIAGTNRLERVKRAAPDHLTIVVH